MANANGRVCCGKTMVEDHENFELVCQNCHRVEELAIPTKSREEVGWTAKPISYTNLRRILKKHEIFDAVNTISDGGREVCDPSRWKFLGSLIRDFREFSFPKSVNYICFSLDYFRVVPKGVWPRKKEILTNLFPAVEKTHPATRRRAKDRFDEWWWDLNRTT